MSADERESQLSAMFDGELPAAECELLARRLSRDPALKRQWARYSMIGAVLRDEPLRPGREVGGQLASGIASRLVVAIEAEQAPEDSTGEVVAAVASAATAAQPAGSVRARWLRPAAALATAAGVAALSVLWLQGRTADDAAGFAALNPAAERANSPATQVVANAGLASAPQSTPEEVIAPPAATRGVRAEVVMAGNGYPALVDRGPGSGEPASYVVPMPSSRAAVGPPAQLANYVVAHSEFSAPLLRRSLLSALVAADSVVAIGTAPAAAVDAPAGSARAVAGDPEAPK